ncbi:MAG: hypothetical protein R3Y09_10035 [Clostridia bacterium]
MKKTIPYILIAILGISQFYSYRAIEDLENQVWNYQNQLNSAQSSLSNQISNIYTNVDEKLEEQASIIFSANTEFGEFDADTLTVPITFTVEPKQVNDSTSVSLKFDDETIMLEKGDTVYSGTKIFTLSGDEIYPNVIIKDGETQNVTQDRGLYLYNLVQEFIPRLYPDEFFGYGYSYVDDPDIIEFQQSGEMYIKGDCDGFESVKYVTYIDGKVAGEIEIDLSSYESGESIFLDFQPFELLSGQTIATSVVAVDKLGFIHEYPLNHHVVGSDEQHEPMYGAIKITTENGEVIYDSANDEKFAEEYGFYNEVVYY